MKGVCTHGLFSSEVPFAPHSNINILWKRGKFSYGFSGTLPLVLELRVISLSASAKLLTP